MLDSVSIISCYLQHKHRNLDYSVSTMTKKTKSELTFENFCDVHGISWKRVNVGENATPDYRIILTGDVVFVEVKQIDEDDNFNEHSGHRIVGSHVREKIKEARKQVRAGSDEGAPSILIIYNNLDGLQMFGTEEHDFIAAMYGEMTLLFDKRKNKFTDYYHGRNRSFSADKSTYFTAVGFLFRTKNGFGIHLYENVFAKHKLDFSRVPSCIEVTRFRLENDNESFEIRAE
jgi:hypothetical protein